MIREYKFGIIIGALYGLITPLIAALGLVSQIGGMLGFILALPGTLLTLFRYLPNINTSGITSFLIVIMVIVNVIFYAFIGGLLQRWLKKKRYVIIIFAGIIALLFLLMTIEATAFSNCSDQEQDVFYEFEHYQGKNLKARRNFDSGVCSVNFRSSDSHEQIVEYYKEQFLLHGWEITKEDNNKETIFPYYSITAEKGTVKYTVSAQQYDSTVEARIRIRA